MTEVRLGLFNLSHTAALNAQRNSTPPVLPALPLGLNESVNTHCNLDFPV